MAGKPERNCPKTRIELKLPAAIYAYMQVLVNSSTASIRSFSQLVEAVMFWVSDICAAGAGQEFAFRLRDLKADKLRSLKDLTHLPRLKQVHVSVDGEALSAFCLFTKDYPALFSSRHEAFALVAAYALEYAAPGQDGYLARRFYGVLRSHSRWRLSSTNELEEAPTSKAAR